METEALLRTFFASPNELLWDATEDFRPWIERVLDERPPFLLPLISRGRTYWYLAANSRRDLHYGKEQLQAFLGKTYADSILEVDGERSSSGPERALYQVFGRNVLKATIKESEESVTVYESMERFRLLLDAAPERSASIVRPTGRILAEFYEAIRAREAGIATNCIDELALAARLEPLNIAYLEIYRDEVLQDWDAILQTGEKVGLLKASNRPNRVMQAFLRALYATEIARFETDDDPGGAKRFLDENLREKFSRIFATRKIYDCREAEIFFALLGTAEITPEKFSGDEWLLSVHGSTQAGPLEAIDSESDSVSGSPEVSDSARSLEFCAAAIRDGYENQWDEAWRILTSSEMTKDSVELMVHLAGKGDVLEWAERARTAFSELPAPDRDSLREGSIFSQRFERIEQLAAGDSGKVPESWVEWLEAVATDPDWVDAAEVAQHGCGEWSPNDFKNLSFVRKFESGLNDVFSKAENALYDSFSDLLSGLEKCPELPPKMSRSLDILCNVWLSHPRAGRPFFITLADVLDLTLRVGISDDAYIELLQSIQSNLGEEVSASNVDGLLEILRVLDKHPAKNLGQRASLAGVIANEFVRHCREPGFVTLAVVRNLLESMDCEIPPGFREAEGEAKGAEDSDPLRALEGKSIALYSLTESVLRQVSSSLEKSIRSVKISLFSDKVGNPALKRAARNADVFVIATASAAHSATNFIENNRDKKKAITVKPDGKGMSSMLRALEEAAAQF